MYVINFCNTNCVYGRQYIVVNRNFWELTDNGQIDFECKSLNRSFWLPASLIQRFVFHLWWNLIYLPKLYMTSEEEGRAKLSLSSNYRDYQIISLPLSAYRLPSTVLLVDRVCLFQSCEQACIPNESIRKDWRGLSERRRMKSMNLHRKHNWDTLGLTCISWSVDLTR